MGSVGQVVTVRVEKITVEAEGIRSYDLRPCANDELAPFKAGAHVDVHLPNGLVRSYSLLNSESERNRYVIGVNLDEASRGGSRYFHEAVNVGDILEISHPHNNFPLVEEAEHSVLIAGGIGITPIFGMARRLRELGRSWELYYCARDRGKAAFVDEILALGSEARMKIHPHFDKEADGRVMDLADIIARGAPNAHYYCCGPTPMLRSFENATAGMPRERVHVEYFGAQAAPALIGGFSVVLARSGRTVEIPPGTTILDALLGAGVPVPSVCQQGVCGTCETKVLEGIPDHRDFILTDEERASNRTMMICCSGSLSGRLVLDL